ncbi:HAMP domain-containing sensor histidine kinase [Nibrella viscosa]|uniref:histidine kinase n=1 Tax=Nibrella viscosa TaxID=1084524 RepID=A0ABP8KDS6_9BACT
MTIRTRLTLLFLLLVASIMLLFSVSIYYLFDQFREDEFQQRLENKASAVLRGEASSRTNMLGGTPPLFEEQIAVFDLNGRFIFRNGVSKPVITSDLIRQVQTLGQAKFSEDGQELLGLRFRNKNDKPLLVFVSGYDHFGFSKLQRLRQILLFGWLCSLVIVGIAGWVFATDTIRPVSLIIDQVNAISATSIHNRLRIGAQRDELSKLAYTFNNMLSRLEEAFVAQKSFVSHASHELRTPLTVMMGQIEVTLMQSRTKAEYETTLLAVLDEVKRMNNLVSGLLELARVNSDTSTLPFKPVRIDELLWQARGNLLHKSPSYQVQIDFQNLPDREEDLTIMAEESLLQTAFQNLMENGCKYSSNESVLVQISFQTGQIQLMFIDRGFGIPEADLPHVFNPFYRAKETIGIEGHGIGLALTHRIIAIHQGQIWIDSQKGKGTTIYVTFALQETVGKYENSPVTPHRTFI